MFIKPRITLQIFISYILLNPIITRKKLLLKIYSGIRDIPSTTDSKAIPSHTVWWSRNVRKNTTTMVKPSSIAETKDREMISSFSCVLFAIKKVKDDPRPKFPSIKSRFTAVISSTIFPLRSGPRILAIIILESIPRMINTICVANVDKVFFK